MNLFELFAKLSLDSSDFSNGLSGALGQGKSFASTLTSALGTADKAITNVGTKAVKAVGAAATAATVAVGKLAKDSVEVGANFDKSMSQVAATMGKTVDEILELRDFAQEMGATTAFSASQAADALNYMALAGYDTEKSMTTLPNVLNLAAAGNIELARASDMVTDAETALGLTSDETTAMVDQMAKTASMSNTSVEQLGNAILTIGSTARFMTGGTTELNSVLGILADNGIKGSEAGTHLRNMLLKLSAPSKDGALALDSLGVSIFDATGKMRNMQDIFGDLQESTQDATSYFERYYKEIAKMSEKELAKEFAKDDNNLSQFGISLVTSEGKLRSFDDVMKDVNKTFASGALSDEATISLLSDIFNTRDVAAAVSLMGTGVERWEELGDALDNASGAADKMAKTQLNNLTGDITLFKSALEGAQIVISDQLTPSLRGFVQFGTEAIGRLSDAFKEGGIEGVLDVASDILSEIIVKITDKLPDIVNAVLGIVKKIAENLAKNKGAIKTAFESLLKAAFTGIPQIIRTFLPLIKEIVPTIGKAILEYQYMIREVGFELIVALVQSLAEGGAEELVTTAVDLIMDLVNLLIENAPLLIQAAFSIVSQVALGIAEALPELIPAIVDLVLTIAEELTSPDNLMMLLNAALELIKGLAEGLIAALPVLLARLPEIINNVVSFLLDAIPIIIRTGTELLQMLLSSENIDLIIGFITEQLPDIIFSIIEAIMDHLPDIIEAGFDLLVALVEKLPEIITKVVDGVGKLLTDVWEHIKSWFGKFKDVGGDLVRGIWEGIQSWWSNVVSGVKNLVSNLVGSVKNLLGIHSPSKVFASIGENMAAGLGEGWSDEFSGIKDDIEKGLTFDTNKMTFADSAIGKSSMGIVNGMTQGAAMDNGGATMIIQLVLPDRTTIAEVLFDPLRKVAEQRGVMLGA